MQNMKKRMLTQKMNSSMLLKLPALIFFMFHLSCNASTGGDWSPHTRVCYGAQVYLTACPMPSPDYCNYTYSQMVTGPLRIAWYYFDDSFTMHDMFTGNSTITYHLVNDAAPPGHGSLSGNPFTDNTMVPSGPNAIGSFTWLSPIIIPGDPGYEYIAGNNAHYLQNSFQYDNGQFAGEFFNPDIEGKIIISASVTNVPCHGLSTGAIMITSITGSSGTYVAFQWNIGLTTENISNVDAGCYTITVTDDRGCTGSNSWCITQPPILTFQGAITNVSCNGLSDGAISVTVSGGTQPYTPYWSPPITTLNPSGLGAGVYNLMIIDAHGCTVTGSFIITQPSLLHITNSTITNIKCHGDATGAVNITVTGGTLAYTDLWSNTAQTQNAANLTVGTYSVTITDSHGCTCSGSWTLTEPADLPYFLAAVTHVSCHGYSDGEISVTPYGGTPGYTLDWSNQLGHGNDVSGLEEGNYCVTLTDANGCHAIGCNSVTEPPLLEGFCMCMPECHVGTADLTIHGGTMPYTYLWNNGATTQDLDLVPAGTYTWTVTDACGAFNSGSCTLVSWDCDFGDAPDNGSTFLYQTWYANNGSRHIVNPNVFLGSCIDAENNGVPNALANGDDNQNTHCADDEDGVTFLTSLIRDQYVNLSVVASVPGYLDAWIDYDHSGGWTGSNEHIFAIEHLQNTSNALSFLVPSSAQLGQTYMRFRFRTDNSAISFNGRLADGEVEDYMVNIIPPQAIFIQQSTTNPMCHGYSNGGINISVSGGIAPYSYLWSNGASTQNLNGISAGTYTVTVTDIQASTATVSSVVNEPTALILSSTVHHVSCNGGFNGSISVTVNGGTPPYFYLWTDGYIGGAFRTGLPEMHITLWVNDANNCIISASYTVTQPPDIVLQATTVPASCPEATDGSIDLSVTGGTPTYGYYWSNTTISQDIGSLASGTYSVTVTDAHSCKKSGSYTVTPALPVCQSSYAQNDDVADTRCYDATWTIYVAGLPPTNPTTFKVENGGNVTMIAGNNIIYYPGTRVFPGGYMWGYIAPTGPWCPDRPVSMVDVPPEIDIQNSPVTEKSFFMVYPNPTTGGFSLELKGIDKTMELRIEIYGMQGEQVFSKDVHGQIKYDFSLSEKPAGVYFIRVVSGKYAGTSKIIKQ
jgi:hypothetical protein